MKGGRMADITKEVGKDVVAASDGLFTSLKWFQRKRPRAPDPQPSSTTSLSTLFAASEEEEEGDIGGPLRRVKVAKKRFGRKLFKRPRTPPRKPASVAQSLKQMTTKEVSPSATLNERLFAAGQNAKSAISDPRFSPMGASVDLMNDAKVSFTVHLYADGYKRVDLHPQVSGPQTTTKNNMSILYPYDRHSHDFLLALDLGLIPPAEDLPETSSCLYESGCLIAEIHDHRSKLAACPRKVLLRPDGMSVLQGINSVVGSAGDDHIAALYIEADILRFTKQIDLRPFDLTRFHRYGCRSSAKMNVLRIPGFIKKTVRRNTPSLSTMGLMLTAGAPGRKRPKVQPQKSAAPTTPYGQGMSVPDKIHTLGLKARPVQSDRIRGLQLIGIPAATSSTVSQMASPSSANGSEDIATNPKLAAGQRGSPASQVYNLELFVRQNRGYECVIRRGLYMDKVQEHIRVHFADLVKARLFLDQMVRVMKSEGFVVKADSQTPGSEAGQFMRSGVQGRPGGPNITAARPQDGGGSVGDIILGGSVGDIVLGGSQQRRPPQQLSQQAQQQNMARTGHQTASIVAAMQRANNRRPPPRISSAGNGVTGNLPGAGQPQAQRRQQTPAQQPTQQRPQQHMSQQQQSQHQQSGQAQPQQQSQQQAQYQQQAQQAARNWNNKVVKREPSQPGNPGAANATAHPYTTAFGMHLPQAGGEMVPPNSRGKWTAAPRAPGGGTNLPNIAPPEKRK